MEQVTMGLRTISIAGVILAAAVAWGEDDRIVASPEVAAEAASQQHLMDLGGNFDANLFEQQGDGFVMRQGGLVVMGNRGMVMGRRLFVNGREVMAAGAAEPPESPAATHARRQGEARLARIEKICAPTDAQRRILLLAMESDIRRFAAEIDGIRARYAGVRVNVNDAAGQKRWSQFQEDVQRCRQRIRDIFGGDSLFGGVLRSTLGADQFSRIEAEAKSRRSFRWRALVSAVLVKLDDTLGLTEAQHDVVERQLLAREPRLRIDDSMSEQENQHLQTQLVFMVLSGGDHTELKASLSDRQWGALALQMNHGKAMRSWIEQQGILEPAAR